MNGSNRISDRQARMVLSTLIEPGDADLDALVAEDGAPEALERLRTGDVGQRLRRLTTAVLASGRGPAERAAALERATEACGARVMVPGDAEWPDQIRDLDRLEIAGDPHLRAPRCLWVRGAADLAEATTKSVAVIGSKAATDYGSGVADKLGVDLSEAGWTVVSTGAFGIARSAHLGALARGGATVAVLACGLDQPHPRTNEALFRQIARHGALVSEWPPGAALMRHRTFTRNRLVAALTAGTVVVEAGLRSGARNGARYAAELGRVLMFTPGPVTSSLSAGVHQLAREDWGARLITCAADVIDDLEGGAGEAPTRTGGAAGRSFAQLSPIEQMLVEALPRGYCVEAARIAAVARVPAELAADALASLRDSGWVKEVKGRWRLTPPMRHG